MELLRAFATIVSASAAPYGYTLTIWSCGAVLIHARRAPSVGEVFLFLSGAVAAFALLWGLGRRAITQVELVPQGSVRARFGALDLFAVGSAVGAAALIAMIPSWVAWPSASFGATFLYLIAGSLQLAAAESRDR
jgi:uncharacterized membrane protein